MPRAAWTVPSSSSVVHVSDCAGGRQPKAWPVRVRVELAAGLHVPIRLGSEPAPIPVELARLRVGVLENEAENGSFFGSTRRVRRPLVGRVRV